MLAVKAGVAIAALLSLTSAARANDAPMAACAPEAVSTELVPRLRLGQFVDVHTLALTLDVVCPPGPATDARRIVDALALLELDETERARATLDLVARSGADPGERRRAAVLLAWWSLRQRDDRAFDARLRSLPPDARARLALLAAADDPAVIARSSLLDDAAARAEVARLAADYQAARRTKRPWLAGTLSAVLPGAGQVYAGSWQAAAVSFVLNAAFIGATAELATRKLYLPSIASGLAASFFYVGNVINAADLAARRNEVLSQAPYRALEERLVPEAFP